MASHILSVPTEARAKLWDHKGVYEATEEGSASEDESASVSRGMKAPKLGTQMEDDAAVLGAENYDQLSFDGTTAAVVTILLARLPHVLLTRFKNLLREEVMDIFSNGLATSHHERLLKGITVAEKQSEENAVTVFEASEEAFVDRIATSVLKHLAPSLFKMLGLQMKNVCGEDDAAEINAKEEAFGVMLAEMMLEDLEPYLDVLLKSFGWKE